MNLRKPDPLTWLFIGSALLVVAVVIGNVWLEANHPCTRWGEEKVLYYQNIGGMIMPVSGRECLERK